MKTKQEIDQVIQRMLKQIPEDFDNKSLAVLGIQFFGSYFCSLAKTVRKEDQSGFIKDLCQGCEGLLKEMIATK